MNEVTAVDCVSIFRPGSLLFQENHEVDVTMTNDDILGDEIPPDQLDVFRRFCYQTLKLNVGVCISEFS